jgi:actin-related protein
MYWYFSLCKEYILKLHVDISIPYLENVSFEGFSERMSHAIKGLAPDGVTVKVIAPPERRSSAWIGGSVVASLSSFDKHLISRKDYEEFGPGIIHRKCAIY